MNFYLASFDARPEASVLARVFEGVPGRLPHRNTAQDKRASAVDFFVFVIASLFADLSDGVELLKMPPRDSRRVEDGGERLGFAGRMFPRARHQVWEA